MCGIAGLFKGNDLSELDKATVERMTDRIAHRGPDGSGYYFSSKVGLGHRRLAIIDLNTGQQPQYNEDRSVAVVFNGEIYNFKDIRKQLEARGHQFSTDSDTEVLVHAWEEWQRGMVKHLRGMFAFAIWDNNSQELFLARDRLGIKPLYYHFKNDMLAFASELKSIELVPQINKKIAANAVEDYFSYGYVPDPATIYEDIYKLQPGYTLYMKPNYSSPIVESYWDLQAGTNFYADQKSLELELIQRLKEAVDIRLMADVPLGAFLSGGVDSSAVVALMSDLIDLPVKSTSIGFNEAEFDESEYAAEVARRYACDHQLDIVTSDDLYNIDRLVDLYDEPYADSSALPTFILCQSARQRVKVALSGDGGDELFAGYRGYPLHLNKERIRRAFPEFFRKSLFGTLGSLYPKFDSLPAIFRAKTTFQTLALDAADSFAWGSMISTYSDRKGIYSKRFLNQLQGYTGFEVVRKIATKAEDMQPLQFAQYIDFKLYLPGDILTKVDRASMVNGLEVRVPVLDHKFVEWAFALDDRHKIKDGKGKHIFKQALKPYLSDNILYRKKKGFSIPLSKWLRGPLLAELRKIENGHSVQQEILSPDTYLKTLNSFLAGKRDHSSLLWSILLFEKFLNRIESQH